MAAVQRGQVELATGAEGKHAATARAMVDLVAGDPVIITADSVDTRFDFAVTKATAQADIPAVAIHSAVANTQVDVLFRGELDGFVGLTPGGYLTVVAGAIDDTAPAAGVTGQLLAMTPTRIAKLF